MGDRHHHARRLGLLTPYTPSAVVSSRHPAIGVRPFDQPEPLSPQTVGSFRSRRSVPVAGGVPMRPGEISLGYGGGYVDTHEPYSMGFVNRGKQVAGIGFGWINAIRKLTVSTLPFFVNGVAQKSTYQQYGRKVSRFNANGNWWDVVQAVSQNTGFVAATTPGSGGGANATPDGQRQGYRYGVRQAPGGPIPWALEIPRPTTIPKINPAISIMPKA